MHDSDALQNRRAQAEALAAEVMATNRMFEFVILSDDCVFDFVASEHEDEVTEAVMGAARRDAKSTARRQLRSTRVGRARREKGKF